MSESTAACIRGCAMYRRHLVDCEDPGSCPGCLPRRAEHGNLCKTCHRRFELMLHDAPGVYRWLTGNLQAGSSAARAKEDHERAGGGKGAKSAEVPAPVKLEILDVRDLLADRMTCWVDDLVETVGLTGPETHTIEADCRFLRTWLVTVERLEWVGDWWEELAETMSDAHALAPWRPAMRRIKRVPCPGCGECNLAIFGGESDVTCLSCRIMMTEDKFGLWERVLKMDEVVAS
jgi:hypothetical protein